MNCIAFQCTTVRIVYDLKQCARNLFQRERQLVWYEWHTPETPESHSNTKRAYFMHPSREENDERLVCMHKFAIGWNT